MIFGVCLKPIQATTCRYIFRIAYLTPNLVLVDFVEFLNHFMQGRSWKIVQKKLPKYVRKTWKLSVFAVFGSIWGNFLPANMQTSHWKSWSFSKLLSHRKFAKRSLKLTGFWVQSLLNVCQHSDSRAIQKVHKFFSMSIRDIFKLENRIYLCTKHTEQLDLSNIPIYEICRNFNINCIKTLKVGKFWIFCHSRCQFEMFPSKNCNYLFIKDY